LWETARGIARGHGLGDLGSSPGKEVRVDLETDSADPVALFGVLEVCRSSDAPAYRELACRIGDNIVEQHFHRGFFLPSAQHVNANFNALEPLALLSLEAMLRGDPRAVPRYNGGRGYIHGPHDGLGRTTDATAIWSRKK
jgi:pectate lyase